MCLSPITIKNPFFGLGQKGINRLKNTWSTHVQVPCGTCSQCISMRQSFFAQRVQMESTRSYVYFITLTYNDEMLPKTDIKAYKLPYPEYSHVQKMLKRIRKKSPRTIRYAFVSEYGTKRHRPHYHALFFVEKMQDDDKYSHLIWEKFYRNLFLSEWKVNVSKSTKFPRYVSLFTYINSRNGSTFDFHYVEPVQGHDNDTAFYVSKYMMKFDSYTERLLKKIQMDIELNDKETKTLRHLVKPRAYVSKDLGDWKNPEIQRYINKCIADTPLPQLPQYVDIYTGNRFLLSRYYRSRLESFERKEKCFEMTKDDLFPYSMGIPADMSLVDSNLQREHAEKLMKSQKKQKKICEIKFK